MWEFALWFGATLAGGCAGTMLARWQIDRRKAKPDQWMRGYETGMMDATKTMNELLAEAMAQQGLPPGIRFKVDMNKTGIRTNGYDA